MDSRVRDLYKRFVLAGRNHPQGLGYVRQRVKEKFKDNALIASEIELKKCIAYGRYQVREMLALISLHKYRAMRKRYGSE